MNRDRARELLPIIQAFADGEEIQARRDSESDWRVMPEIAFPDEFEYRIKPKPREWWLCWDDENENESFRYPFPEYKESTVTHWDHYIKVLEVK